MSRTWMWLSGMFFGFLLASWLFVGMPLEAGKLVGETDTYSRDMGFETQIFYVAAGSDGEGKPEYICEAFPGTTGSDDLTSSIWRVMRLSYNTDDRASEINYAGDDDAFVNQCSARTSLNYD